MATSTVETISVSFVKMKEDVAKPVPGYFIHEDEAGNPMMTEPVLIPIAPNPNERNETWKGYIKVEKAGPHYFRIDGDDVLTLKIPHAQVDITTGGGSLSTCATQQVLLERGFYYCELTYNNRAYTPVEKSYEGCKAAMSTEGVPQAGKYVQYDTSKSQLCGGEAMTLMKLGKGCRIDWPKKATPLASPIEWFEVTVQEDPVTHKMTTYKWNNGTISSVSDVEFKQIACIIFAEQSQYNEQEYLAIASVFPNRWGHTKSGTPNRNPIETIKKDFDEGEWKSIGSPQYIKAMEGKLEPKECQNLDKARETLEKVLGMATPPYPYDRYVQHPGQLDPSKYVTIGGHDFYKNKEYSSCAKPEGWEGMPIHPKSPLNKP